MREKDAMKPLFEVKPIDREFYSKHLRDWLPDRMIDMHTHVWLLSWSADFIQFHDTILNTSALLHELLRQT